MESVLLWLRRNMQPQGRADEPSIQTVYQDFDRAEPSRPATRISNAASKRVSLNGAVLGSLISSMRSPTGSPASSDCVPCGATSYLISYAVRSSSKSSSQGSSRRASSKNSSSIDLETRSHSDRNGPGTSYRTKHEKGKYRFLLADPITANALPNN